MQAIVTTFLGPTNTKGSRVVAKCDAKRIVFAWDHGRGTTENHEAAARILLSVLGWDKRNRLVSGSLPGNNGYCHVMVPKD
jgi:hypothetical protein